MRCGLLGRHLTHSYSQQIHSYLGSYRYDLFEIEPEPLFERRAQRIRRKAEHLNVEILGDGPGHQAVADATAHQKRASARIADDPRYIQHSPVHRRQSL